MQEFVMHLLVLSHAFVIPHLKRMCERKLEKGMVTTENVVDIFQLALLCDAPRVGLICHRLILRNFKAVSATEGWEVMKKSHPILEKLLLESLMESDNVSISNFLALRYTMSKHVGSRNHFFLYLASKELCT